MLFMSLIILKNLISITLLCQSFFFKINYTVYGLCYTFIIMPNIIGFSRTVTVILIITQRKITRMACDVTSKWLRVVME